MIRWNIAFVLFVTLSLLAAGCSAGEKRDLRGAWDYTMTADDGNVYDTGSIEFSGKPESGIYRQMNIYAVEYVGEYACDGNSRQLSGYENWEGAFEDGYSIKGVWSHDDGAAGTFSAKRR